MSLNVLIKTDVRPYLAFSSVCKLFRPDSSLTSIDTPNKCLSTVLTFSPDKINNGNSAFLFPPSSFSLIYH